MKGIFVDYKRLYRETSEMLEEVGLNLDPKQCVRGCNSGQMQMISIARALSKTPRIIVLDEPTSALTDKETDILMATIRFFDYPEVAYPEQLAEADYFQHYAVWRICTRDQLEYFSAVAYYFAKHLLDDYDIPVVISMPQKQDYFFPSNHIGSL